MFRLGQWDLTSAPGKGHPDLPTAAPPPENVRRGGGGEAGTCLSGGGRGGGGPGEGGRGSRGGGEGVQGRGGGGPGEGGRGSRGGGGGVQGGGPPVGMKIKASPWGGGGMSRQPAEFLWQNSRPSSNTQFGPTSTPASVSNLQHPKTSGPSPSGFQSANKRSSTWAGTLPARNTCRPESPPGPTGAP